MAKKPSRQNKKLPRGELPPTRRLRPKPVTAAKRISTSRGGPARRRRSPDDQPGHPRLRQPELAARPARAARRCSRISSCARRSSTSTTSASRSASCMPAARRAHGYFELHRVASRAHARRRSSAKKGKRTPVFARFSTVAGGAGSVDTPRDVRGFAVKFYTKEGNWDLVGNNIPVFFIQDAIKFPDLIHAVKMEADRGFPQAATRARHVLGLHRLMPESTHMIMWAMSDRTLPRSLRMMEGFGVHTFRFVNARGESTLRQVPLAAAGSGMQSTLLGRGGEDRRRRSRLPSPRPVRGDRRGRLPGVGARRAAVRRGVRRRAAVRRARRDQAHSRRRSCRCTIVGRLVLDR